MPFVYDLRGRLSFAVAQDAQFGPTDAQLLDPENVVLRDVNIDFDTADNEEMRFGRTSPMTWKITNNLVISVIS